MPRQQRHLARDDTELRAARVPAALLPPSLRFRRPEARRLRQAGNDVALGAAKVEIDRLAGRVAEDDDRRRGRPPGSLHDRNRDLGERACGQAQRADEGREMGAGLVSHWRNSGFSVGYIYPDKLLCQYCPGKYRATL
jgi:hypothetical protein